MKTCWHFPFEYEDLLIEKPLKYGAIISKEYAKDFGLPEQEFEASIEIESDKNDTFKEQFGRIHITLPGNVEMTEPIAKWLAFTVCEQITFTQGRMKLSGGYLSVELLPETEEEEKKIDGKPFTVKINLVQKLPSKVSLDNLPIYQLTSNPLITQFNEAKNANNPIDSFIGFFKILEDLYGGQPLKANFKNSTELKQIALDNLVKKDNGLSTPISEAQFESLVDAFVDTRHECAHLRSSTGFGITYGDSRVKTQVEPILKTLRILAYRVVQKHINNT